MPLTVCLLCNKPIISNEEVYVAFRGFMRGGEIGIADIYNNEEHPDTYFIHEACARPPRPDPSTLQRSLELQPKTQAKG